MLPKLIRSRQVFLTVHSPLYSFKNNATSNDVEMVGKLVSPVEGLFSKLSKPPWQVFLIACFFPFRVMFNALLGGKITGHSICPVKDDVDLLSGQQRSLYTREKHRELTDIHTYGVSTMGQRFY